MSCRIRVAGHPDPSWPVWFDGLTITHLEDGESVLTGHLTDQAALYGALSKLRDLGLRWSKCGAMLGLPGGKARRLPASSSVLQREWRAL